jgi:hypothetical protein
VWLISSTVFTGDSKQNNAFIERRRKHLLHIPPVLLAWKDTSGQTGASDADNYGHGSKRLGANTN